MDHIDDAAAAARGRRTPPDDWRYWYRRGRRDGARDRVDPPRRGTVAAHAGYSVGWRRGHESLRARIQRWRRGRRVRPGSIWHHLTHPLALAQVVCVYGVWLLFALLCAYILAAWLGPAVPR